MDVHQPLATGKLPPELLESLLRRYGDNDPRLVVGPRTGEDAAVIEFGDRYLLAKTDPITFATDQIGWYAVNVNANDIAVMGGTPCWFLAAILLPAGKATPAMAEEIFAQISASCSDIGVTLAGGHTEVTYDLDRPIVAGVMLGEVAKDGLVTKEGAREGDLIMVVKPVPIEGASLIAREKRADLVAMGFEPEWLDRVAGFLHDPGISVLDAAQTACAAGEIHAMHDPTEGGIATGLWEISQAADVGLEVDLDEIPILPEAAALCEALGLDPLGTIASGSLLVVLPEGSVDAVGGALEAHGYPWRVIGRVTAREDGLRACRHGRWGPLPRFPADEITKLF